MRRLVGFTFALILGVPLHAQFIVRRPPTTTTTNPLAAARVPAGDTTVPNPSWAAAGATIVTRTTQCVTAACLVVTAGPASAITSAQVSAAIVSAPSNSYVLLPAGTYTVAGWTINRDDVTVRGISPASTIVNVTSNVGCQGITAGVCIISTSPNFPSGTDPNASTQNNADWTAGYTQGATQITLSANTLGTTKPTVGTTLFLDQINDSDSNTWPAAWICETITVCSSEGGRAGRWGAVSCGSGCPTQRGQHQIVTVTAISAGACPCTVTVTPPLAMDNWRAAKSPGAWWSNVHDTTGVGLEHLRLNFTGSCAGPVRAIVTFFNAEQSWIQNVETQRGCRAHVLLYQSHHITIRDSYLHESSAYNQQSYGVEWYLSDWNKVENTIVQHVAGQMEQNGSMGNVVAYNYLFEMQNTNPSNAYLQTANQQHATGNSFSLAEGNDSTGLKADAVHGTSLLITGFRNRLTGCQTGSDGVLSNTSTHAIHLYVYNEFFNFIGNVMGDTRCHSVYKQTPATGFSEVSVVDMGQAFSGAGATDQHAADSAMLWGNWDVITNAVRWCVDATAPCIGSEVPSTLTNYANPVPSSHALPNSLYLSAKPSWFGSTTYPPIGPDVTGGDIASVGGFAYKIPARQCYENGAKDASGFLTAFNNPTGAC